MKAEKAQIEDFNVVLTMSAEEAKEYLDWVGNASRIDIMKICGKRTDKITPIEAVWKELHRIIEGEE